ncbi:hypothetical protein KEM48_013997 [Puccinia striiformis f. sp. tritici PST-130]|nr:hypothetical protein KEM48_013997 [Puccinia striiformis f. sp. tritici PST-130]
MKLNWDIEQSMRNCHEISKTAKESLEDGTLDVSILLRDIDEFLVSIPPAEWRRRANDNVPLADMPFGRPPETGRPRRNSRSSVTSYASTSFSKPGPATESSSEVELNNHLTEIFAKIGSPIDSKKGISDLYQLLKMHPEANSKVDKWIKGLMPSVSTSRPTSANIPASPSMSTFGSDNGAAANRISRSHSQDVDLTRLQSLFGFEATTTSPLGLINWNDNHPFIHSFPFD